MNIALLGAAMLAAAVGLLFAARPRDGKSPRFMDSRDGPAAAATVTTALGLFGLALLVAGAADIYG